MEASLGAEAARRVDVGGAVVRRRVVVRGLVQGVGFRYSTAVQARANGVSGDVSNLDDGTVLEHLEGPAEAVDRVLAWIRAGGPPSARVDGVEVTDEAPVGRSGFSVV